MKRPSFQFYPGDWLRDTGLRSCSVEARGLWMDMLCLMHEGTPYGHLKVGDKVISQDTLGRMVGLQPHEVEARLTELRAAAVFSTAESGALYSRRMVRDEENREKRGAGGAKGGNPALLGNGKDNPKVNGKDNQEPTLEITPSSASASASPSASSSPSSLATTIAIADAPPPASQPDARRASLPNSLDEVKAHAAQFKPTSTAREKPDDEYCYWWWSEMEGCGWVDTKGRPIHKWKSAFDGAWSSRCHNKIEKKARGFGPPGKPHDLTTAPNNSF